MNSFKPNPVLAGPLYGGESRHPRGGKRLCREHLNASDRRHRSGTDYRQQPQSLPRRHHPCLDPYLLSNECSARPNDDRMCTRTTYVRGNGQRRNGPGMKGINAQLEATHRAA